MQATAELIGEMFYAAPGPLHQLVRKCYNPTYNIPDGVEKTWLQRAELIVNNEIPEQVKRFILDRVRLTEDGGISMTFK